MKSYLVSIIIPHFNRAEMIKSTLESVFNQSYSNWEIIIIDDNSEIDQINLLLETVNHPKVSIFQSQSSNKGPSACRNQGVNVAKGEYLIFLDSDDILAPFCLEHRIKVMHSDSSLDFAVFPQFFFQKSIEETFNGFHLIESSNKTYFEEFLELTPPWSVTCPIWRSSFLKSIGGFDVSFFYMEDPELHVRAIMTPGVVWKAFPDATPDSYYRVGNMDGDKAETFYINSVLSRISFIKKVWYLYIARNHKLDKKKGMACLRAGVYFLLRSFILSRVHLFKDDVSELVIWLRTNNIISLKDELKVRAIVLIYANDNYIFRFLKIKGMASKLLIPSRL